MRAFSLSSPVSQKNLVYLFSDKRDWSLSVRNKLNIVCQTSGNVAEPNSLSSVLTKGSSEVVINDRWSRKNSLPHGEIGIVQFYRGKNIFVTGATGFLAKVFIEKILRTMPDVGTIFVLIMAKSKEAAMQRLENEVIDAELFKSLRQTYGKSYRDFMIGKLVPVLGNISEFNLGLEEHAVEAIAKEVDIIVNSAANTTFDERYDVSLNINMGSPIRLLNFAKNCRKLQLFLHISTVYANRQRHGIINETLLGLGYSAASDNFFTIENEEKLVLDTKETFDDNTLPRKLKELGTKRAKKHGWTNTYVFTKAMGEMMIDSMRGELPVVIIRPSVIESTYKDPFPGWIEGNRMMDPVVISYGKGQITGFPADPNGVLDVVPVDMVVNATLAAIAKHALAGKSESHVYHLASSVSNPLVFKDLCDYNYQHFKSMPCIDSKGDPIYVSPMKLFDSVDKFSSHLQNKGTGLDSLGTWNGKLSRKQESLHKKIVEQAKNLANIYRPFLFHGERFDNSNTKRLTQFMSEEETKEFGFDVDCINWEDYITNTHIPGLRRYVMKGKLDGNVNLG